MLAEEKGVNVARHSYFPAQVADEIRTVVEWNDVLADDEALRTGLTEAEVVMVWIGFPG